MQPFCRRICLVLLPLLSSAAAAQVGLPLSGTYAFGEIRGGFPTACSPGYAINAEEGLLMFQSNGTFTGTGSWHRVCANGTPTDTTTNYAGSYNLGTNSLLTLDFNPSAPGTNRTITHMRPDGEVAVGSAATTARGPGFFVMVKLSSGQSNASLQGTYHWSSMVQRVAAGGLASECELGTIAFSGTGSLTSTVNRHEVAANGNTNNFPSGGNKTYTVNPNGTLTGAGPVQGALSASGDFVFIVDRVGTAVELGVGMRRGSSYAASMLNGTFGYARYFDTLGSTPNHPVFAEEVGTYAFNATAAMTASAAWTGATLAVNPSGSFTGGVATSGTVTLNPDGTFSLLEAGAVPPGEPGALDARGTFALVTTMQNGVTQLSVLARFGPWPQNYGTATAGSGGIAPTIAPTGGFPFVGNAGFGIQIANAVGGSAAVLGLALQPSPGFPVFGGILWLSPVGLFLLPPLPLSGGAGVPGAGAVTVPLPLPRDNSLGGVGVSFQAFAIDPLAPLGVSMTDGLQVTLTL